MPGPSRPLQDPHVSTLQRVLPRLPRTDEDLRDLAMFANRGAWRQFLEDLAVLASMDLSRPIVGVQVAGRCPACGGHTLFLGAGGYPTCPLRECPDPTAAADLLLGTTVPTAPAPPATQAQQELARQAEDARASTEAYLDGWDGTCVAQPDPDPHPRVLGQCMACREWELRLGGDGTVVCHNDLCPDRMAMDKLLGGSPSTIGDTLRAAVWALERVEHPHGGVNWHRTMGALLLVRQVQHSLHGCLPRQSDQEREDRLVQDARRLVELASYTVEALTLHRQADAEVDPARVAQARTLRAVLRDALRLVQEDPDVDPTRRGPTVVVGTAEVVEQVPAQLHTAVQALCKVQPLLGDHPSALESRQVLQLAINLVDQVRHRGLLVVPEDMREVQVGPVQDTEATEPGEPAEVSWREELADSPDGPLEDQDQARRDWWARVPGATLLLCRDHLVLAWVHQPGGSPVLDSGATLGREDEDGKGWSVRTVVVRRPIGTDLRPHGPNPWRRGWWQRLPAWLASPNPDAPSCTALAIGWRR